jgi:indolepyruvate ferredoxin oxidoreductase beta subunit
MSEKRVSMLLVGVGGQGVLRAGRILGDAALAAGRPAVVGQLHGMSQRGGSVECSVLFGPGRSSYLWAADVVVGFEPLETLRARPRMGSGTRVLLNPGQIMPPWLVRERKRYPPLDEILAQVRSVAREVVMVDGPGAMRRVGKAWTLNSFMLGALAGLGWLPLDAAILWEAIERQCVPSDRDANRTAFSLGRSGVVREPTGRSHHQ